MNERALKLINELRQKGYSDDDIYFSVLVQLNLLNEYGMAEILSMDQDDERQFLEYLSAAYPDLTKIIKNSDDV